MEVRCSHCGQAHKVPRDIFDGLTDKVDLSCTACGGTFPVINPKLATLRLEPTDRKFQPLTDKVGQGGTALELPKNQALSLKVLEGAEKGTVYPVSKPRLTIGRSNADISVNDLAASRVHCALEISVGGVLLRDLGSTNGTTVNDEAIETAILTNGSTFRVGQHVFQLIITPKGT